MAHEDGGRSVLIQHKVGAHKLLTSVHCRNMSQIPRFVSLVAHSHKKLLFSATSRFYLGEANLEMLEDEKTLTFTLSFEIGTKE